MKTYSEKLLRQALQPVQQWADAERVELFVVGGILRDQFLGREPRSFNVDFAVAQDALALSKNLARRIGAAYVPLDIEHGSVRLVMPATEGIPFPIELDLNDFRGKSLDEDLRLRDFTLNAMAMPLNDWLCDSRRSLTDPLRGLQALKRRRLEACHSETFNEDPLRILRGFRLSAQLGFALEARTLQWMREAAQQLNKVAPERIRDEFFAILETDRAYDAICGLDEIGVLGLLFPEVTDCRDVDQGDFHHLDVMGHLLEAVRQADLMLADLRDFEPALRQALQPYVNEKVTDKRSRKALIKFSALLHDIGKPAHRTVNGKGEVWFLGHEHTSAKLSRPLVQRLALSNRESDSIVRIVHQHLRPGYLSRMPELTRRALYRFYKDLDDDGPACILEWWCDRMATRGKSSRTHEIGEQQQRMQEMLKPYFFKPTEVVRPVRLIDGNTLMQELQLNPSPLIGEILEHIEEAQADGQIKDAAAALDLAREYLQSSQSESSTN